MDQISRRRFLKTATITATCAAVVHGSPRLFADPLGLPVGLQLYSVRDLLPKDYEGTLRQLGALGYREVEAAGFYGRSASDVKRAMKEAGLRCVSAHYPMAQLQPQLDELIQYGKDLGLKYMVCSSPMLKDAARAKTPGFQGSMHAMTLEDWRWNAEQFNHIGERVNAAGMRFGYHNHIAEFRAENGVVPYDELLRLTDPAKVTMEMDCGWVMVGGGNPVEYLTRHAARFSLLHIKDFKLGGSTPKFEAPPSAELGRGSVDYRPIFQAAKKGHIEHAFVEQEQFDMAPMEALKIDADYMHALTV